MIFQSHVTISYVRKHLKKSLLLQEKNADNNGTRGHCEPQLTKLSPVLVAVSELVTVLLWNQCEYTDLVAFSKYRISLIHLCTLATGIRSDLLCDSPHFRNTLGMYTT